MSEDRWRAEHHQRLLEQAAILVSYHEETVAEIIERRCESPIERLLASNLSQIAPFHSYRPMLLGIDVENQTELVCKALRVAEEWSPPHIGDRPFIVWAPQIEVDRYRTDFMLVGCFNGMRPEQAVCAVIECDGFEWHERTKEQAIRDREKDRTLQEYDCKVFRFLGTEIWENPGKCARRVIEFIDNCLDCKRPGERVDV